MSRRYCWSTLSALAVAVFLQSVAASSVVFKAAEQQSGANIPAQTVTLEARAVWYKCGLKTWDRTRYLVNTVPPTQEYTTYVVKKSEVKQVSYKTDGTKRYPLSARAKCTKQVLCEKTIDPVYFNYYERCLVVSSESLTTPLIFTVSATSKQEIKVFILWGGVGLVGLIVVLMVLNCLWGCVRSCCPSRNKYSRYGH